MSCHLELDSPWPLLCVALFVASCPLCPEPASSEKKLGANSRASVFLKGRRKYSNANDQSNEMRSRLTLSLSIVPERFARKDGRGLAFPPCSQISWMLFCRSPRRCAGRARVHANLFATFDHVQQFVLVLVLRTHSHVRNFVLFVTTVLLSVPCFSVSFFPAKARGEEKKQQRKSLRMKFLWHLIC